MTATLQATRAQVYDAIVEVRLQEDRLRLARDLHDKVANSIAAVTVGLDVIRRFEPELPPAAIETVDLITESAHLAMQETREIVTVLRSDEPSDEPELEDLESTLMQMQVLGWFGVDVEVTSIGESVPLSPVMDECATRCIRETVTNAGDYGVSAVAVEVDWREDPLKITIQNRHGPSIRVPDRAIGTGVELGSILLRVVGVGGALTLHTDDEISVLQLTIPRE